MSYQILWEQDSFNELNALQNDIAQRILEKIEEVREFPEHFIKKLKGMPEFKIRIGDYRIILLFDKGNKTLRIQAIGHRKNVYKKYKAS